MKQLSVSVDMVVKQALRLVDKNEFRYDSRNKKNIVYLAIPDRVRAVANARKELVNQHVQVMKPPPLPPYHTWGGWGP
jgi:hypothetical protein